MKTRSIAGACRYSEITYKTALSRLRKLENLFGEHFVNSTRGGTQGTKLTDAGLQLIREYYTQANPTKLLATDGRRQTKSQLKFQAALLDQIFCAVIATDLSEKILYWNRFAETLYQWKSEEILHKRLSEVMVTRNNVNIVTTVLNKVAANGRWEGQFEAQRKDGSVFGVQVFVGLVRQSSENLGFVLVSHALSAEGTENGRLNSKFVATVKMIRQFGLTEIEHAGMRLT
jgi:molybdate transport repressor ModE-like protein